MSAANKLPALSKDALFYIVLALAVISAVYWMAYGAVSYSSFHDYFDLGQMLFNMNYYLHYPSGIPVLQFLVYSNHVAPLELPILLIFSASQSPFTLLFIQYAAVSAMIPLVFFIARELTKSRYLALALAVAFFLNPGIHGLLLWDYHTEFLIIPFYLLSFYYYMKRNRRLLFFSFALLLLVFDVSSFVALSLALGLLAYDFLYNRRTALGRERMANGMVMLLLSVAAVLAYAYIGTLPALQNAYLPPLIKVLPFNQGQLLGAPSSFSLQSVLHAASVFYPIIIFFMLGIAIALFGFGMELWFAPLPALILLVPWLFPVASGNAYFLLPYQQYYAFAVPGAIAACILGFRNFSEKKGSAYRLIFRNRSLASATSFIYASIIVASFSLFVISVPVVAIEYAPASILSLNSATYSQFSAQINSVIAMIPQNSSLMAMHFMLSHVYARQQLEVLPAQSLPSFEERYFTPEYVLVDFNSSEGLFANIHQETTSLQTAAFNSVLASGNYSLYARNGSAMLYRLSSAMPSQQRNATR